MTGLFERPIINMELHDDQRRRGVALLIAREARPTSSVTELVSLAEYVVNGRREPQQALPQIFGNSTLASSASVTLPTIPFGTYDPVHPHPANPSAPLLDEGWRPAHVDTFDEEEPDDEPR